MLSLDSCPRSLRFSPSRSSKRPCNSRTSVQRERMRVSLSAGAKPLKSGSRSMTGLIGIPCCFLSRIRNQVAQRGSE